MVTQNGMGITPLTWSELRAWRLENGMSLEPFEVALIHLMSSEYVAEYHAGSKKGRQSPVEIDEEEIDREAVGSKISNIFGAMLKKQRKRDNNEDDEEEG
jgi:hypothetical protein